MIEQKATRINPGAIQLAESWEVLFHPLKTCLERVGGIDHMMGEIEAVMYSTSSPTWRDEVNLTGHSDKSIRFSWEPPTVHISTLCPTTRERFQDWVMQTMQEMGYEGWSVVDRVVTSQASDD